MRKIRCWVVAVLAVLMVCCGDAQFEYSRRPCNVVINNAERLDPTLASAMNSMAPGIFCLIQQTQRNGASFFSFSSNQNQTSEIILTDKDKQRAIIVGMNNGVIVGFGNIDYPPLFYAYDRECPNCFDPDAIPMKSRPLSMDFKGHATCGMCHRVYDMNNRGFIIEGEKGSPLTRYPATTSGPFGALVVQ